MQNKTEERGLKTEDGGRRKEERGRRRRKKDRGRRMEDSRQDLRTEFRAATESSGLAGFGLASAAEEGWRAEDGRWKMGS